MNRRQLIQSAAVGLLLTQLPAIEPPKQQKVLEIFTLFHISTFWDDTILCIGGAVDSQNDLMELIIRLKPDMAAMILQSPNPEWGEEPKPYTFGYPSQSRGIWIQQNAYGKLVTLPSGDLQFTRTEAPDWYRRANLPNWTTTNLT